MRPAWSEAKYVMPLSLDNSVYSLLGWQSEQEGGSWAREREAPLFFAVTAVSST